MPDVAEERSNLGRALGQIFNRVNQLVSVQSDLIAQLRSRPVLANPFQFIEDHEADMVRDRDRGRELIGNFLHLQDVRIENLKSLVTSLSPQKTLDRGYSVVRDAAGHVVADGSKVKSGTKLKIRLAKGEIGATAD